MSSSLKHSKIIGMSDDQLRAFIKNDDPDCETHDMIEKELYFTTANKGGF